MNTINNNVNIFIIREENHLNVQEYYLEIEFNVSDYSGGIISNDANVRLLNYGVMALFSSIRLETISGKTIEYIDHCHPNLLICKLITIKSDENKSAFVRDQKEGDGQLKVFHQTAQREFMYGWLK